jgi:hypothetical protein
MSSSGYRLLKGSPERRITLNDVDEVKRGWDTEYVMEEYPISVTFDN